MLASEQPTLEEDETKCELMTCQKNLVPNLYLTFEFDRFVQE